MGHEGASSMALQNRLAGVLLHPTSLPGGFGIGDLGKEAFGFIDFLKEAKHRIWHMLPLGPVVEEEFYSPYATVSGFASNHFLLSLDRLVDAGLLERRELAHAEREAAGLKSEGTVNFRAVEHCKLPLLRRAARNFRGAQAERMLSSFCAEHSWVEEYAEFAALRLQYGGARSQWPAELRSRSVSSNRVLKSAAIQEEVLLQKSLQYLFFEQWSRLREYAQQQGVMLFGDLPLYVSRGGADVWANPHVFALDVDTGEPTQVSGVPPEVCNKEGQLWGHPVYDWERMKADGFRWWIERFRAIRSFFDVVRIDHFIGFSQYWSVPVSSNSARDGRWIEAPGAELLHAVKRELGELSAYVEDLGEVTQSVTDLRDQFGLMGIKVLQYDFDGDTDEFSVDAIPTNVVVCTGNHDNAPITGWYSALPEARQCRVREAIGGSTAHEVAQRFVRAAMSSPARICVVQMQDLLGLGAEARMNRPGVLDWDNWSWRLREIPDEVAPRCAQMAEEFDRVGESCSR